MTAAHHARQDKRKDLEVVWIEKYGKNIELLDHVLEKLNKTCKSYP